MSTRAENFSPHTEMVTYASDSPWGQAAVILKMLDEEMTAVVFLLDFPLFRVKDFLKMVFYSTVVTLFCAAGEFPLCPRDRFE